MAITLKDRKIPLKIKLIEKSPKKTKFLKNLINELHIDVEVINQNILERFKKIIEDVFVARAFKPLKIILNLYTIKLKTGKKFLFSWKNWKKRITSSF